MKLAYVFHRDAAHPGVQSGRPAAILEEFERLGVEIERVFPLATRPSTRWVARKIGHRLLGRHYRWDREPAQLAAFAREIRARTAGQRIDAVFSPGSEAVAHLDVRAPVTFCADATFANLIDYYGDFTHVAGAYLQQGHAQETAALMRARLAVYPSEWAARSAIEFYRADPERVAVIPFGANLGRHNTREQVEGWIHARPRDCLRLLFVGRHWRRKGGPIVADAAERLRQLGHNVQLDVVGCEPPSAFRAQPWVRTHGMLRAHVPAQLAQLEALFARAHFVFVPSRAEAYGLIFAEGNAFGLPVVTTATGGITSIVRDGWNGLLCPPRADAIEYAAAIGAAFQDGARYRQLCRQAFGEFDRRLNWRVFCQQYLDRVRAWAAAADIQTAKDSLAGAGGTTALPVPRRSSTDRPPLRVAIPANRFLDPENPDTWSGLPYFTRRALEEAGIATDVIRVEETNHAESWLRFSYWRVLRGRRYLRFCNERLLRSYARQIEDRLAAGPRVDAVFSVSTWLLAFLRTDRPTVLYTDACFGGLLGFYASFSNLASASVNEGHHVEQLALERCTRVVYSSDWAAESARAFYAVPASRIDVVPFGANFHTPPRPDAVAAAVERRELDRCNLLLVGVDWARKGVDTAIAVVAALRARGRDARLTIVGCRPPRSRVLPEGVEVVPFMRKDSVSSQQRLRALFERSHFFILPSRAEASPIVFSEACAFGLPCLGTNVGGLRSIVRDDVNGRLFALEAPAGDYADYIAAVMADPARYRSLALGALAEANQRLSWRVSGPKLAAIVADAVGRHAQEPERMRGATHPALRAPLARGDRLAGIAPSTS